MARTQRRTLDNLKMMSNIQQMYFAFATNLKEHVKISIGSLKPPRKMLEQFNGLGN